MIRIVKKLATFILSIILFILISIVMFIQSSKTMISKENLSNYVKSVDILNVDLGIIFNLEEKGITLKEQIYNLAIESKIPDPIINDILKSNEINNILGDFFKNTIDYVLKGTIKPIVQNDTINKMIDLANISLEDHINIIMDEDELEVYIKEYCLKLSSIVPERSIILDDYTIDKINQILYFDISNMYILILIVCLLLCIINRSIYKSFKYLGIVLMIIGLIFVMVGCLNDFIGEILSKKYVTLENFILPLITNILTIIFKNGVLMSFSGVFIYLIYIVYNRIKLNNKINKLLSKQ